MSSFLFLAYYNFLILHFSECPIDFFIAVWCFDLLNGSFLPDKLEKIAIRFIKCLSFNSLYSSSGKKSNYKNISSKKWR